MPQDISEFNIDTDFEYGEIKFNKNQNELEISFLKSGNFKSTLEFTKNNGSKQTIEAEFLVQKGID